MGRDDAAVYVSNGLYGLVKLMLCLLELRDGAGLMRVKPSTLPYALLKDAFSVMAQEGRLLMKACSAC
jgi:hypothetical protein